MINFKIFIISSFVFKFILVILVSISTDQIHFPWCVEMYMWSVFIFWWNNSISLWSFRICVSDHTLILWSNPILELSLQTLPLKIVNTKSRFSSQTSTHSGHELLSFSIDRKQNSFLGKFWKMFYSEKTSEHSENKLKNQEIILDK